MQEITVIDKRTQMAVEQEARNEGFATLWELCHKNYTPEFIREMMDLKERQEDHEAKKAYHNGMAEFHLNPPLIEKEKRISFEAGGKVVEYNHASLGNVSQKINVALAVHGFTVSWKTTQQDGKVTVTCTITHRLGHSESTSLTAEPDKSGSKNPIQAIASTVSYLERYTVLALTGLATSDMDDDGRGAGGGISGDEQEYINPDQAIEINDLIKESGADFPKFLKFFKADSIEHILAINYQPALTTLKKKIAKQ